MLYTPRLLAQLAALLRQNLSQWGFAESARIKLLHYSENVSFLCRPAASAPLPRGKSAAAGEAAPHIFRFYRPFYHSNAEIDTELSWLAALNADSALQSRGLRFPRLRAAQNGAQFLTFTAAPVSAAAPQPAALPWRLACFRYLRGRPPPQGAAAASPPLFAKLGEMAALLHRQSRAWAKPQNFTRRRWNYDSMAGARAVWGNWRAIAMPAAAAALLERACNTAQSQSRARAQAEARLLIHADMRAANLLISGKERQNFPALLDFDDCGFAFAAQDCANALSFIERSPLRPQLIAAFLSGYQRYGHAEALKAALPFCLMLRRLQLTAWLHSHAETPAARAFGADFLSGTLREAAEFLGESRC